jgi:hydroxymethylpyrimidine/phosphomethylpyrimidine kinase
MKVVLSIAGSDSSGGAGIQADLKTFEAFGVFGTSVITVLTAQNTGGVTGIQSVPAEFVSAQIKAVMDDFDVAAIKIGMLYSSDIIEAVKASIAKCNIPVVLDPVFISKANSPLLQNDAVEKMKELFAYATVITPNLFEAKSLFGYGSDNTDALLSIQKLGIPVLVKNQTTELSGTKMSVDQLYTGEQKKVFSSEFVETKNLHGTGCSYSSAIAANLALGKTLEASIEIAKRFITQALIHAPAIGQGPGPINHKKGGEDVT